MAKLGFKSISEMIGRTEHLKIKEALKHWKATGLDLSPLLYQSTDHQKNARKKSIAQNHHLTEILDHHLLKVAKGALEKGEKVQFAGKIKNSNRTTGAMLSGEVAKRFGEKGLPDHSIDLLFTGSAGQSFGAFLAPGITLRLEGESNDYVGKSLSGGKIVIAPPKDTIYKAHETIILGNTALYGATSGEVYFQGCAV